MYGDAMAAGVGPRLDHHLGRGARRPPAGAVRHALRRLALRPRPPHRHQLAARLRRRAGLQALLLPPRQRRTQGHGDRRRLAPDPSEPAPGPARRRALVFALDDSPTKRYGPHVEGAGKHHNPTPGPAGAKFLYGHVWVCLAWLVRHPQWGAIALPILLPVCTSVPRTSAGWRRTTAGSSAPSWNWPPHWSGGWSSGWGRGPPVWVVTDGAYAKRPFLKPVLALGVTVISRLRCDAALWSLPVVVPAGQRRRGRPRVYGTERIDLAKRAGQKRGWQTGLFTLYGRATLKTYKTFLATYKPVGGVIRVVLVREPDRWVAYFATDPSASVASILEAVADRSALEQVFHDVKEVHGAGQQQLRHVWANVGAWNLIGWWHTLVELWAWHRPHVAPVRPERVAVGQGGAPPLTRRPLPAAPPRGDEGGIFASARGDGPAPENPPVHPPPHAGRRVRLTLDSPTNRARLSPDRLLSPARR